MDTIIRGRFTNTTEKMLGKKWYDFLYTGDWAAENVDKIEAKPATRKNLEDAILLASKLALASQHDWFVAPHKNGWEVRNHDGEAPGRQYFKVWNDLQAGCFRCLMCENRETVLPAYWYDMLAYGDQFTQVM